MVDTLSSLSCNFLQQRQSIHPRHIDIGDDEVDVAVGLQRRERFDPIAGKQEFRRSVPDLVAELLQNESLEIGLVIDE